MLVPTGTCVNSCCLHPLSAARLYCNPLPLRVQVTGRVDEIPNGASVHQVVDRVCCLRNAGGASDWLAIQLVKLVHHQALGGGGSGRDRALQACRHTVSKVLSNAGRSVG